LPCFIFDSYQYSDLDLFVQFLFYPCTIKACACHDISTRPGFLVAKLIFGADMCCLCCDTALILWVVFLSCLGTLVHISTREVRPGPLWLPCLIWYVINLVWFCHLSDALDCGNKICLVGFWVLVVNATSVLGCC
jgi:hypothetical protein